MPSLARAFRFARRPILAAGLCAAIGISISARADDRAKEAEGGRENAKPEAANPAAAREDEDAGETAGLVERLMGKKPELRFQYIQENAKFVDEDELDV